MNDETVVGRVWGHPVSPGVLFDQMIQIPIRAILNVAEVDPEVNPVDLLV